MRHEIDILFFACVCLSATSLGFGIAWLRARSKASRLQGFVDGIRATMSPEREVMPALDAIATEVERIGEGQRFLTKIMADQSTRSLRSPGVITPH